MTTTLFALVLFGCADDGQACVRLHAPAPTFATRSACEGQLEAALQSDVSLRADYPLVTGRCLAPQGGRRALAPRRR